MAKPAKLEPLNLPTKFAIPQNVKDLGYQFSVYRDLESSFADIAKELIPTISSGEINDEQKAELLSGCELRFGELHPAKLYLKEGADNYVPIKAVVAGKECIKIDVHTAMGFTSHAFGKLRKDSPNYHALVKKWRDDFSQYSSNKIQRLIAACMPKAERKRGVNLDFSEFITKLKDDVLKRAKTTRSKGGEAPTSEQLNRAWDAFSRELAK